MFSTKHQATTTTLLSIITAGSTMFLGAGTVLPGHLIAAAFEEGTAISGKCCTDVKNGPDM